MLNKDHFTAKDISSWSDNYHSVGEYQSFEQFEFTAQSEVLAKWKWPIEKLRARANIQMYLFWSLSKSDTNFRQNVYPNQSKTWRVHLNVCTKWKLSSHSPHIWLYTHTHKHTQWWIRTTKIDSNVYLNAYKVCTMPLMKIEQTHIVPHSADWLILHVCRFCCRRCCCSSFFYLVCYCNNHFVLLKALVWT